MGVPVRVSPIRDSCQTSHPNLLLRPFPADVSFSPPRELSICPFRVVSVETMSRGDRSLGENHACLDWPHLPIPNRPRSEGLGWGQTVTRLLMALMTLIHAAEMPRRRNS